jgi:hypothetical protein
MAIWYILWSFGIFFPVLVCCTEKNLAALVMIQLDSQITDCQNADI